MIVFDHVQKTVIVLALADVRDKSPSALQQAYDDASQQVDRLIGLLETPAESLQLDDIALGGEVPNLIEDRGFEFITDPGVGGEVEEPADGVVRAME